MNEFTATEQAFKNGWMKGYDKGLEDAMDFTIVHCKDCKYFRLDILSDKGGYCTQFGNSAGNPSVHFNDFCSYGEKPMQQRGK